MADFYSALYNTKGKTVFQSSFCVILLILLLFKRSSIIILIDFTISVIIFVDFYNFCHLFFSKIGEEQTAEDAEDGPPELLVRRQDISPIRGVVARTQHATKRFMR